MHHRVGCYADVKQDVLVEYLLLGKMFYDILSEKNKFQNNAYTPLFFYFLYICMFIDKSRKGYLLKVKVVLSE